MDVLKGGRKSWWSTMGSRFEWVSSSPSPAEVLALEEKFFDIIQIPADVLVQEESRWESNAIIARSLSRWIPPDAIIREFRRSGVPGEVEAVTLAFRCYIFCFSDPIAKNLVLGRPWTVNGQVLATAVWRPEFIPAANSLTSALLWLRLPNLPLEFWHEDILRPILSPTGEFVALDAATLNKSRGGFARACVRVDLGRPLRPGVRVRGSRSPFWQQYVYEHLEGICSSCGSLHFGAPCSNSTASVDPSVAACYGPWMAALRQRRAPQGPAQEQRYKNSVATKMGGASTSMEGWQSPVKVARRCLHNAGQVNQLKPASVSASDPSTVAEKQAVAESAVGKQGGAESVIADDNVIVGDSVADTLSVPRGPQKATKATLVSQNPFAILGTDMWAGRPKGRKDAVPGPSKRARPAESISLRVTSKNVKGKGKVTSAGSNIKDDKFIFSAVPGSPQGLGTLVDTGLMATGNVEASVGDQGTMVVCPSPGGSLDMEMAGAQDGVQGTPQPE